jgi:hypothetical protein
MVMRRDEAAETRSRAAVTVLESSTVASGREEARDSRKAAMMAEIFMGVGGSEGRL